MVKNRNSPESLAVPLKASWFQCWFSTILRYNPASLHVPVSILPIRQPCLEVACSLRPPQCHPTAGNILDTSVDLGVVLPVPRILPCPLLGLYEQHGRRTHWSRLIVGIAEPLEYCQSGIAGRPPSSMLLRPGLTSSSDVPLRMYPQLMLPQRANKDSNSISGSLQI